MKVILAYSGGLDTSIAVKWLKEKYNAEVITYTADLGQGGMDEIKEKALKTGAVNAYVDNLKEEFVNDYIFPSLKAGALYQGKYPLATALGRPLIARKMVELAKRENADALAHGCTGKGNDQVRFELTFMALAPEIKIIAPAREWKFNSREEEIEYAKKNKIPVDVSKKSPYSIDKNLWGISIECGELEDPWKEPPEDAYQITVSPEKTLQSPEYIEIAFEKGIPVRLNNKNFSSVQLIEYLNVHGSKYGIGRIDMVEDRLIGIKSREIYEAPSATILHSARESLESLILDRETRSFKSIASQKYAELVYYGWWFSPLREALDSFFEKICSNLTGKVKMKLSGGKAVVAGIYSPYSLYEVDLATYSGKDMFDKTLSKGFITLWGLPLKLRKK